jgi:hypothetical protein
VRPLLLLVELLGQVARHGLVRARLVPRPSASLHSLSLSVWPRLYIQTVVVIGATAFLLRTSAAAAAAALGSPDVSRLPLVAPTVRPGPETLDVGFDVPLPSFAMRVGIEAFVAWLGAAPKVRPAP